jgi:2-polyprenyl-3-methyl-5-hydroxy-6-metoxy-1,4-benzoquinol methylase
MTDKATDTNRQWWDEVVPIHVDSDFYDVEGFLAGRCTLDPVEIAAVGDVTGRSLIHLQCHFGLDTLSWARRGAKVTGVDFSRSAIEQATALAARAGLDARFIHSSIEQLGEHLDERFDIVFTSQGVLAWLNDLDAWGATIAHLLEPGGAFVIYEFHPFTQVLAHEMEPGELIIRHRYFGDGKPTAYDDGGMTYASDRRTTHTKTFEWTHTMSEIVNAIVSHGLAIEAMDEFDHATYRMLPGMERDGPGRWRLPDRRECMPLMFAIRARRAGD